MQSSRVTTLILLVLLTACARPINDLSELLRAVKTPPATATPRPAGLDSAVGAYLDYLNELRMENTRLTRSEQRKFDIMTVIAISLGTASAIYGFTGSSDDQKAQAAGITGALAAFTTALIAKFRHSEDAEHDRICAKELERAIAAFRYPGDFESFRQQRDSITTTLLERDCLAAATR